MSGIYFHSPDGTHEVRGTERHYCRHLVTELFVSLLDLHGDYEKSPNPIRSIVNPSHWLARQGLTGEEWTRRIETACRVAISHDGPLFLIDNNPVDLFLAQLDTVLTIGSAELKLLARIDGQCEVHGYVEDRNRKWFADLLASALGVGLLRSAAGWEELIPFTRAHDSPLVMSYSVCDQFPNPGIAVEAGWESSPDDDGDEFYDLEPEVQWDLCMKALRSVDRGLEFKPDDWSDFRFGSSETALTLKSKALRLAGSSVNLPSTAPKR